MSEDSTQSPLFGASPEHEFLATQAGEWKVQCSYNMGPGVDPLEVTAHEKSEMLGPFWLASRLEADMLGTPMHGHGSTGYDPVRKVFVGTWKDSSNPFLYTFAGYHDKETNTLKLSGENYDPVRGIHSTYRSHLHYISPEEKRMTLTVETADEEVTDVLTYHYKRV